MIRLILYMVFRKEKTGIVLPNGGIVYRRNRTFLAPDALKNKEKQAVPAGCIVDGKRSNGGHGRFPNAEN